MTDFELELTKKDELENGIFYRYKYKDFQFWFSQCQVTGNIYYVYVRCLTEKHFEYRIYSDCRDMIYPTKFEASFYNFKVENVEDCKIMEKELSEVKDLLNALYNFFETSEHSSFYKEHHRDS